MTQPGPAFDPTAGLREVYQQADLDLVAALAAAVRDTLANPDAGPLAERRLQRVARTVRARLDEQVPPMVAEILSAADREGRALGVADTS
jgi:hypothetical protein